MTTETFQQQIESIVKEFLQTVVVVDDEALPEETAVTSVAGAIKTIPGRPPTTDLNDDRPKDPPDIAPALNVHDLNPKLIIDSFARQGLVCSVISPQPDDDLQATVLPCVARADLVIFDWVLNGNNGEATCSLIREMLAKEEALERGRLRTIAIYTGEDNLEQIALDLEGILKDRYANAKLTKEDKGLTLTKGPARIAIFAKSDVVLQDDIADRIVKIPDLPDVMRREFAALSTGLVSGVSLAALAALRSDTHRILRALSPELDPSYLGHRAAQVEPSDSEETLIGLVSAEIRSVLDDHCIGTQANHESIKRWLTHHQQMGSRFGAFSTDGKEVQITEPELLRIIKDGLGDDDALRATAKRLNHDIGVGTLKQIKKRATELFTATGKEARLSDALLSERMALRTHYRHPQRALQLGTLVACDGEILVCVQPLCDAVRLKRARAFPFLAIAKVAPAKGADFMFTAPGQADPLRLRIDVNPYGLLVHELAPTSKGVVVASEADGFHTFTSEGSAPATLVWLGQLKPEFAQKVATDLAHAFGRIGLDEHELMRLSRSGK